MSRTSNPSPSCAFCGARQNNRLRMFAGHHALICERCVATCSNLLAQGEQPRPAAAPDRLPKPHEIKEELDRHVIGQDHAKKVLSVAVYNHYKRIAARAMAPAEDGVEIEKSNILFIGPTGSGKTLLARTLARILDVPYSISDATTLTEAGYVGDDVENVLLRLVQAADNDIARAQIGIVYIDEIDKIARRMENVSLTRDVSGEGVQQALLKIMEGTVSNVPTHGGRKHPQAEHLKIDSTNILFICGGAFVGLDDIVRRRLGKGAVGFGAEGRRSGGRLAAEPEDLIRYGMLPEFVGRLPVTASLSKLTEADLVRILTEPRNAMLKQYKALMAMEGVELTWTDPAVRELARLAYEKGTGARGLRAILEQVMLDMMYETPRKKVGQIALTKSFISAHTEDAVRGDDAIRQIA